MTYIVNSNNIRNSES